MQTNPWTSAFGIVLILVMVVSVFAGFMFGNSLQESLKPATAQPAAATANSSDGFPDEAPAVYEEQSTPEVAPVGEQPEPSEQVTEPAAIEEPAGTYEAEDPAQ